MIRVEKELNAFAKEVIRQSRSNLTRQGKRASSSLYKSLDYDLRAHEWSFSLDMKMEDYGEFVDKGVSGKNKKYNTPFRFGTGSAGGKQGKGGAFDIAIRKWIKIKGLKLRDEKGRFAKGGITTLSYLIRRSVFKKGLRPSLFFTKSFENAFKQLPQEITEAYALDVADLMDHTLNNGTTN